jgi:hypothetical protein
MIDTLAAALAAIDIEACNIARGHAGFQVSVRRRTDGWEIYHGADLAETIARAVRQGPQSPVIDGTARQLVGTPAPVNSAPEWPSLPTPEGVQLAFNSADW